MVKHFYSAHKSNKNYNKTLRIDIFYFLYKNWL